MELGLISAGLTIILIDLVLSGDNAVVIGMAAHRLPAQQRRFAILFGAGAAIILRIGLTAVATVLLQLPWLRLIGGGLLFFIGFKLLKEEEEVHEGVTGSERLIEAISTIVIADVVMSVDNILGVAAAAHGDFALLIFGLVLSMAIMLVGGNLIASLIDRLWWLVYLGSAVIVWTGAEMLVADPAIEHLVGEHSPLTIPFAIVCTGVVIGAAHYFHRHRPRQRRLRQQFSER
ncbi:MAG: TerC family protein [Chloroflexi bacterium]|nr:TerC family protein [Chloroflexota bacterium]